MRLCREAHWRYPSGPHARFRCGTKFENGDAPFCNSDSTAAAYATARQCSESTARLQGSDASGSAYGPGVLRRCFLPENDLGYVPIANRLAESFDIYSRSTPSSNFEIGSRHQNMRAARIGRWASVGSSAANYISNGVKEVCMFTDRALAN